MKLLLFTDVHSNKKHLDKVIGKAKNADLIVCLGDISMFQAHLKQLLREVNDIGKPVLMLPGNHELEEDLKDACNDFKNITYFHMAHKRIGGYLFLSYGSGGFAVEDVRFERLAKEWAKIIKPGDRIVLLTHGPPYGISADIVHARHVGNKSITDFIRKYQPLINAFGHLHENFNKIGKIGKTVVLNPGPEGKIYVV